MKIVANVRSVSLGIVSTFSIAGCQPDVQVQILTGSTVQLTEKAKAQSVSLYDKAEPTTITVLEPPLPVTIQTEELAPVLLPEPQVPLNRFEPATAPLMEGPTPPILKPVAPQKANPVVDIYNCSDFESQEEVIPFFTDGDPHRLDRDEDMIPCERLKKTTKVR